MEFPETAKKTSGRFGDSSNNYMFIPRNRRFVTASSLNMEATVLCCRPGLIRCTSTPFENVKSRIIRDFNAAYPEFGQSKYRLR